MDHERVNRSRRNLVRSKRPKKDRKTGPQFAVNMSGTKDYKYKHGSSWLDALRRKYGNHVEFECSGHNCNSKKHYVEGAHVYLSHKKEQEYGYIIPLCKKHNTSHNTNSFRVIKKRWSVKLEADMIRGL